MSTCCFVSLRVTSGHTEQLYPLKQTLTLPQKVAYQYLHLWMRLQILLVVDFRLNLELKEINFSNSACKSTTNNQAAGVLIGTM